MKKLISFVMVVLMLTGCAAQTFRDAREKANLVKNGMTVAEVTEVLGMPPTHITSSVVHWRRGNAQAYVGNTFGAIEFHLENGRVVGVPEGGIFSQAARDQIRESRAKRQAEEDLARKEEQARRLREITEESDAAVEAIVICKDKLVCSKVFALAQIYVQQNADQKIQVATDTIIETYNPTEDGKVGIAITKMPRSGTVEVVKLTPSCKDENGSYERSCRLKRTAIYRGFKPFIERSLSM